MKIFNKDFWDDDAIASFICGFAGGFVASVIMIICFL